MNSKAYTRPKSLTTIKARNELDISSPYLKPIKVNNPCLTIKSSKKIFKRKVNTTYCQINTSPGLMINLDENPKISTSCETIVQAELGLDSESSERKRKVYECIYEKLHNKIIDFKIFDYEKSSEIYLEAFDELIASDFYLGKILLAIKNGLFFGLKKYYEDKLNQKKKSNLIQSNLNSTLRAEKETLINKLNSLSSQNINLMNTCEDLMKKYSKLDEQVSKGKNCSLIIQELNENKEKVKELSLKIEEMTNHENKLWQIIEKFNTEGVDIKKLYCQTPVRQDLFQLKKRKKNLVPSIDLTVLEVNKL